MIRRDERGGEKLIFLKILKSLLLFEAECFERKLPFLKSHFEKDLFLRLDGPPDESRRASRQPLLPPSIRSVDIKRRASD